MKGKIRNVHLGCVSLAPKSRNLWHTFSYGQADKEGSVSKLVSKVGAEAIEMAYWLVKFVGDFEKIFALSRAEDRSDQESAE